MFHRTELKPLRERCFEFGLEGRLTMIGRKINAQPRELDPQTVRLREIYAAKGGKSEPFYVAIGRMLKESISSALILIIPSAPKTNECSQSGHAIDESQYYQDYCTCIYCGAQLKNSKQLRRTA
jgi:hypothetical protein